MLYRSRSRARYLARLALCVALGACGSAAKKPGAGAAGSGASKSQPHAGSVSLDTSGSGAMLTFDASIPNTGLDADGGVLTPEQLFEGVPFSSIPGAPPTGCTDNQAGDDSTLVLMLDAKVSAVRIAALGGQIIANGTTCKLPSALSKIAITGGSEADTVIIDGSQDSFPDGMLAANGGIAMDLGQGRDTLAVMGSAASDSFTLGSVDPKVLIKAASRVPVISSANQEVLIVSAGPGDDRVDASGGSGLGALADAVQLYGGLGDDTLIGGDGDDQLYGGAGDDTFQTAAKPDGADVYDGAAGVDTVSYAQRTGPLTITLNDGPDDGEANERDNVHITVENVIGGNGADNITGSASDNVIEGGPGNDTLNGGDGDDTFLEVQMAQGDDVMNGGNGTDLVDYSGRTVDMTISLCMSAQANCAVGACGCAANDGEEGEHDVLANIENVSTGSGDDNITGNNLDNVISGGAGNDMIDAQGGDDELFGDDGNDVLLGGDGDDVLYSGAGRDLLDGGSGQGDICIAKPSDELRNCELH